MTTEDKDVSPIDEATNNNKCPMDKKIINDLSNFFISKEELEEISTLSAEQCHRRGNKVYG